MRSYYIPILVEVDEKKQLWRFDLNDYSIEKLSQIREILLKYAPYEKTITSIDSLIREKTENMVSQSKIHDKSYIKVYKENKKQDKLRKRTKIRRR